MATFAKSTFSHASYAAFRPSYPPALYNAVLAYHQGIKNLCLDLGCGHGVVTKALSPHFIKVIGTDPSAGMIEQARSTTSLPNVDYHVARAEESPFLKDESVDIVVSGEAAHWFDYPKLFREMKRILRKGGTLAFFCYKDHVFVDHPKATALLDHYTYGKDEKLLGSYWSQPGRSILRNKYRDIKPPTNVWEDVQRIEYEPGTKGKNTGEGTLFIEKKIKLGECMSYIRTWSSYHAWQERFPDRKGRDKGGDGDVVDDMFDEMREAESDWQIEQWMDKEVDIEWGSAILMARRN